MGDKVRVEVGFGDNSPHSVMIEPKEHGAVMLTLSADFEVSIEISDRQAHTLASVLHNAGYVSVDEG